MWSFIKVDIVPHFAQSLVKLAFIIITKLNSNQKVFFQIQIINFDFNIIFLLGIKIIITHFFHFDLPYIVYFNYKFIKFKI